MAAQRDWQAEYEGRVAWIRDLVQSSGVKGIVFGNSGGKDSALVGILCKAACENTVGIIMPCASKRNYGEDAEDGRALAEQYGPRLRMTTLYTIAAAESRLVAGTGNRSEIYMGYFTKWGDGASDFNPIADLTATEVFAFLRWLNAPAHIVEKAPSAGLFEGQTDESEMGVTYRAIDTWLQEGTAEEKDLAVIERYHARSEHKRRPIPTYQA